MDYFEKKQWIRIAVCVVLVAAITLFMTGVIGGGDAIKYTPPEAEQAEGQTEGTAAGSGELLSSIAVSMGNEKNNSYVTNYLEQDPYLVNIYEGYGFAKDYGSARGHYYTLEDVAKTQRPHPKANCLTCKTPDMHKMIAEQGVSVYSMPFDEVMEQMTQPISCYTCHGDDSGNNGQMVVTHQYVNEALGENASAVNPASLSCGQCHIEYYFTPSDSEAMMPYHSVSEMTPDAILAYYDAIDFYDWEQPGTGTKMLKAQHPELETYSQGRHASMLSCADCHMPVKTTESGMEYHDHHLVSPLTNETLLAKCATCHGSADDIVSRVRAIQAGVTARETEVGNRLSALKDRLAAAVAEGKVGEEKLNEVRKLHREAQWYFDYCYVENSEGAHNSSLAYYCLDTADARINEANALLDAEGVPGTAAPVQQEEPKSVETPGEKVIPVSGGYRIVKENNFGKITMIAYVREGKIVSCRIIPEGENNYLKEETAAEWADAIVKSGDSVPDVISSATLTFSSGSVTEAVTEITDRAGIQAAGATEENVSAAGQEPEATAEPVPETTTESNTEKTETPSSSAEPVPETAPAEETTAGASGVNGTYRVTKENQFSKVTVTAAMKDGKLTSVKIESEGEQDLLTDEIRKEWAQAILESGSAAPDAITSSTLTFSAGSVTEAMTEILNKAGGEPATETSAAEPVPETTTEPNTEKTETPASSAEPVPETAPAEETAAGTSGVYGTYRVTKENQFSRVTVTAAMKDGKLTSVKIESEGEQDLLTDEIRKEWAQAILESGSAAPDAITSSTLTFSAGSVTEAVTEILNKAGGAPAAETSATEPEPAAPETAAEPAAEPAQAAAPAEETTAGTSGVYGTYRVTKENQFSKVTVTAAMKDGKLTSVKIESEGEQDLLTDEIRKEWAQAVLESGSAAPDAITSSTLTFSAGSVTEAMTEILNKAGGVPAAETPAAEPEPAAPQTAAEQTTEPTETPATEPAEAPAPEITEAPAAEPEPVSEAADEPAPAQKEEPKSEEAAGEKVVPVSGGYLIVKENNFGKVTIIAYVRDGKIVSCRIIPEGENNYLKEETAAEWADAIVESGDTVPDVISSATLTFSAGSVTEALTEILTKAAGE